MIMGLLRTRMLWFTVGLGTSAAAMSQFLYKDLMLDRLSLSSQLKQQFDSLESRVSALQEASPPPSLTKE